MTQQQIIMVLTILVYLIAMIAIGIMYSKKNKSVDEFYLGGRKLGPLVTAMSAEASDMSSWLLLGLPGVAYLSGASEAVWTAIGLAVGTYLNWLFVAKRIRVYSQKTNSITLPQFFSNRYGDKKNVLNAIAAVVIVIFFIPYTASGFAACGKLFSSLFGIDYMTAMILSAAVIVLYCVVGGFMAVSTTDLLQSIVMSIALIVVVVFGISVAGGIDVVFDNAKSLSGYLSLTSYHDAATSSSGSYGFITIVSTLAWGLGYFGMPHILLRFMAIEDKNKLSISRRIASIWVVISMAVAVFIGFVGLAMSSNGSIADLTESGSQAETVIIKISDLLATHGWFAAILAGVIIAGILASTMSTADSQLLTAASGVSQNLFREVFKVSISEKLAMNIARGTVVVISAIAIVVARDPSSSVFRIVSFAWAGFGAAFGPVILAALFWKRSNKWGALAGMITGGVMIFVWKYLIAPLGGAFKIYELLPAFLMACIAIVVVSLLTKAPEQEITKLYEEVASE